MPKKLPAYILVVVIGALAILIAAFGKFGGSGYVDPNQETVTGEIGSFPPGFTGIPTTVTRVEPVTQAPTPDHSEATDPITMPPTESQTDETESNSAGPDDPGTSSIDPGSTPGDSESPSETTAPIGNEVETDSSACS